MATVSIPFKTKPPEPPGSNAPKPVLVAQKDKIQLIVLMGQYTILVDSKVVLGPIHEEAARARFNELSSPKQEVVEEEDKEEESWIMPLGVAEMMFAPDTCQLCGAPVTGSRVALGLKTCSLCSPTGKIYGVMDYSIGKTAGVLMVTSDKKLFDKMRRPINRQR